MMYFAVVAIQWKLVYNRQGIICMFAFYSYCKKQDKRLFSMNVDWSASTFWERLTANCVFGL